MANNLEDKIVFVCVLSVLTSQLLKQSTPTTIVQRGSFVCVQRQMLRHAANLTSENMRSL